MYYSENIKVHRFFDSVDANPPQKFNGQDFRCFDVKSSEQEVQQSLINCRNFLSAWTNIFIPGYLHQGASHLHFNGYMLETDL